ncbi:MAG: acetyl-CoA carboxylase, carboxyltransferase subunit beta [Pseudomonadota bacterium]
MSWFSRVRNNLPFGTKRDTPDNLWHKCKNCGEMVFSKEYEENEHICPHCGHHGRIGARTRFDALFDEGRYDVLESPEVAEDPLKFRDSKKYTERLKTARANSEFIDALTNAKGDIDGQRAVVGVQDFAFMGGSMGMAVGSAFLTGINAAIQAHAPYIIFTAAGGARMQEGILSLMQMPRATVAIDRLKSEGLPYIVVLTDPTTGGVTASYAMLGDIHIAEPGALIGFAGQRVIENTIREKLPEGFQRAEYLLDHGMIDMVVHRHQMRDTLAKLIGYMTASEAA